MKVLFVDELDGVKMTQAEAEAFTERWCICAEQSDISEDECIRQAVETVRRIRKGYEG